MTLSCPESETKRIYFLSHNSPLIYIKHKMTTIHKMIHPISVLFFYLYPFII
ncbi:hypothetical protein Lalb_Chr25g0283391 [Lupinus albus]|uniref:Uncharacterized protein n=1 Tax=Lupinus albus TaxID=3870 RepID=A0A6A4NE47_LUPAL|nr:hypothetical protein Lalb_Chr25g0283391 [Lupinus albus]